MPAQNRDLRKNHILILSDEIEEQRAIESVAKSVRVMKDYIAGLMASVMRRDGNAR